MVKVGNTLRFFSKTFSHNPRNYVENILRKVRETYLISVRSEFVDFKFRKAFFKSFTVRSLYLFMTFSGTVSVYIQN